MRGQWHVFAFGVIVSVIGTSLLASATSRDFLNGGKYKIESAQASADVDGAKELVDAAAAGVFGSEEGASALQDGDNKGSAAADRQPSRRRRSSRCSRRERRDAPAAAAAPAVASGGGGGNTDDLTALKALDTMLRKYDRRSTPTNDQGIPTNVSCQLFVASLSSINTEDMDYETDAYLRQEWIDQRLSSEEITSPLDLADPRLVKAIWKPEVYFPNAKEANFQFVTVPNVLIRIHPGGEILYILRLRLKFSCMMELSRYPLDTQICAMQISSFSKTTKELLLEWDKDTEERAAVSVAKDLRMPQFAMKRITTNKCNSQYHMGNYSCLAAEFHLHRSIGFHLIQSYLPSTLIVGISWVSFWMDVDCVPARVTLGVITLLSISGQVANGISVPQTSYIKAIDVWMGVCTAFVFATLVEFTCVNYLWRKRSNPYKLTNLDFNGFPEELRAQAEFDAEMECGDGGGNGNCSSYADEKAAVEENGGGGDIETDVENNAMTQTESVEMKMMNNSNSENAMCCLASANDDYEDHEDPEYGGGSEGQSVVTARGHHHFHCRHRRHHHRQGHGDVGGGGSRNGQNGQQQKCNGLSGSAGTLNTRRNAKARMQRRRRAVRVDEVCRYLFPMLFILFNAWYWYYYRDQEEEAEGDDTGFTG